MKKLFAGFIVFVIANCSFAQHQLVKLWETDSTLKVPESVCFDGGNKALYVSNIDGTDPWAKDGKGSIGKLTLDGKILAIEWVTGLNAPKGMGLYKDNLYVADLTELVVIDVNYGKIVKRIPVPGATGLNDVSVDGDGNVYVTDMKGKKIYKVKDGNVEILAQDLKNPNGILKTKKQLFVLDDGTLNTVNKDKTITKLADGFEGGTDGIENIKGDEFIISCWAGVVYYVNTKTGAKEVLLDGRPNKKNSADIGFNAKKKIIYVPSFWKNTVTAYEVK